MSFKSFALGALLLTSPALAVQQFSNKGTLDGWNFINREHNGAVDAVTNVVREGPSALKMTQTYDPNYSGRYHSEVVKDNVYKLGDTGFYGFSFRLQETWQFSPAQSYNIAQFIADFGDTGCDDFMPSSMVWLVGNQLYSRVKQGSVCNQRTTTFANLATVSAGAWHKVEIQASWKADDTGFYKVWFDGVKVLERFNLPTTVSETRPFEFRVGLYANGWHDDGGMKGSQGTRSIWYDEIAAGTEFKDADPDQW